MVPAAVPSVDPYFRQRIAAVEPPDAAETVALIGQAALRLMNNKTVARVSPKKSSDNAVRQISDHVTGHNVASSYADQSRPKEVAVSFPSAGRITPEQD